MLTRNVIPFALLLVACMAALLHVGSASPQRRLIIGRNINLNQQRQRRQQASSTSTEIATVLLGQVPPSLIKDMAVKLFQSRGLPVPQLPEGEPTAADVALALDQIPTPLLDALTREVLGPNSPVNANLEGTGMPAAPAGRAIRRRARQQDDEANDNTISAAEITKLVDEGGDQQPAGRGLAIVRDRRGRLFVALPIDDSDPSRQGRLNPLLLEGGKMALENAKDLMKGFNEGLAGIATGGRRQTLIFD